MTAGPHTGPPAHPGPRRVAGDPSRVRHPGAQAEGGRGRSPGPAGAGRADLPDDFAIDKPPDVLIGIGAGAVCYGGVLLKTRLGYDDSLDVVGIHGMGGTWGALATGLFASTAVNPGGADGLFFGNPKNPVI